MGIERTERTCSSNRASIPPTITPFDAAARRYTLAKARYSSAIESYLNRWPNAVQLIAEALAELKAAEAALAEMRAALEAAS